MVRSSWKIKKYFCINNSFYKKFKIHSLNFVINSDLLGFVFYAYVGNKYRKIIITDIHVGCLMSTLVVTRFNDGVIHKKDKKKKKNNG